MVCLYLAVLILLSGFLDWSTCALGKTFTCSMKTLGRHKLYQKVNGDNDILFCFKENGQFKWKFIDGSPTLGEKFDPAEDCSDIVDNVPDAKDGFYWVVLAKGKIGKVWCDVHIDGGGFMLVGKMNGPSTWSVPSSRAPVDPTGSPHWSSKFGYLSIRDFAIQISTNNSYTETKASSPTLGEKFDPAEDCSDIVDNVPDAKDGFYWVVLAKGKIGKVWCDVHIDGGGFMLVGKMNGPSTWSVPSSRAPVDPTGSPHWSSKFGYLSIRDFAIQISTNNSYTETKASWMYKLKKKRNLGSLFGLKKGGCTDVHSGIGNVEYIKDILTETIVTKTFMCSKFGPHFSKSLGWGRMNHCLKNPCRKGYAFFPGFGFKYDVFGSFSYSAPSPFSGITHNSTAFIGCDHGKCCACYGPKGGRGNYCAPKCKSINGGIVTKQVIVWFWVRTRVPTRLYKRCMEFTIKNKQGNSEIYFIDKVTGFVRKGSCSRQFQTFLNEGTLTVLNKEALKNLPSVPGLLLYRKDNKELYVNNGKHWGALSKEKEVEGIERRLEKLEERTKILSSCSAMKKKYPDLRSGPYWINPVAYGGTPFEVYCDMSLKNGAGVTVIGHDSEERTLVNGYESQGSYSRKIVYKEISKRSIAALTNISRHCRQYIKWECHDSVQHYGNSIYGWWVSRQGNKMTYWGGATGHPRKCACAMTNSCAGGGNCNCDMNDYVLRKDEGYLTDKNTLPVSELRFGDTGDGHEYGYHTLGKLFCWE